jgi:hypothetical protein
LLSVTRADVAGLRLGNMDLRACRFAGAHTLTGYTSRVRRCWPKFLAGGYRRPQVRYERRGDIVLGFLHLACALICLDCLKRWQA